MPTRLPQLLEALRLRGVMSSKELQGYLEMSQPSVSRLIQNAGDRVLKIGQARRARYGLAHDLFSKTPIYAFDQHGVPEILADLQALRGGEFYVVPHRPERWLLGEGGDGLYPGLPYFLDDLRPQGFIGRAIAGALGSPYPVEPESWNSEQVLRWLIDHGAELPGNLVVGDRALEQCRARRDLKGAIDLPQLAEQSLSVVAGGSSVGGEQPKFVVSRGATQQLVKFCARGDGAEASRWRDILIAEHHALATLTEMGKTAAESTLVEEDGRTFLVLRRFDREGEFGRRSMLSLRSIGAEFSVVQQGWTAAMRALSAQGLVSSADTATAAWLELFGHWIGNNDMHLGNLSLSPEADGFRLLPVYDMTSMLWAPIRGDLPRRDGIKPPARDPRLGNSWTETARAARKFWSTMQAEPRLSEDFRRISSESRATIDRLLDEGDLLA